MTIQKPLPVGPPGNPARKPSLNALLWPSLLLGILIGLLLLLISPFAKTASQKVQVAVSNNWPSNFCSPALTPTSTITTTLQGPTFTVTTSAPPLTSTVTTTMLPPTSIVTATVLQKEDEKLKDHHGDIPWHGNTFQIVDKATGKAITDLGYSLELLELEDASDPRTMWYCVEKNAYFGFQNLNSRKFLGHDGHSGVRASAFELNAWEMWTPPQDPNGAYELLSPFWEHTLMGLHTTGNSWLTRRTHGVTVWVFRRV